MVHPVANTPGLQQGVIDPQPSSSALLTTQSGSQEKIQSTAISRLNSANLPCEPTQTLVPKRVQRADSGELAQLSKGPTYPSMIENYNLTRANAGLAVVNLSGFCKDRGDAWNLTDENIEQYARTCSEEAATLLNKDETPHTEQRIDQIKDITFSSIADVLSGIKQSGFFCPSKGSITTVKKIAETKAATEISFMFDLVKSKNLPYAMYLNVASMHFKQYQDHLVSTSSNLASQGRENEIALTELFHAFQCLAFMKIAKLIAWEEERNPNSYLKFESIEKILSDLISDQDAKESLTFLRNAIEAGVEENVNRLQRSEI